MSGLQKLNMGGGKMDNGQTSLFLCEEDATCSCYFCRSFAELKNPWELSGGGAIYGYCFKSGDKEYSLNMGKGFPVYIIGGKCKDFKRKR